MCRRVTNLLILAIVLCSATTLPAAHIIFVNEGAAGDFESWQTILEGAGHTAENMTGMNNLDQGKIDAMNAADLVIVSRDTNSGGYDDGEELAQWNGLTVPLMQCSSYLVRSNRWRWVDNTGNPGAGAADQLLIVENHSIFKGLGSAGDSINIFDADGNLTDATDGGNGQILATHPDGRLWITYWEEGAEFYSGSGEIPAAPRMWLAAGTSNKSGENLTPEGEKLFLNAIAFMTGDTGGASNPIPADAVVDVIWDDDLSWMPNEHPGTHNLYLGTSFDDVNTMTVPTVAGLDVNSYDPGRLEFGQTYYWRVDEVNASPDMTVFRGGVWSFTVEPYSIQIPSGEIAVTASSSSNDFSTPDKTIDGSGLSAEGAHDMTGESMWFTAAVDLDPWIQFDFDDVEKIDVIKVWNSNSAAESAIGWGVKDLEILYSADGENWEVLADANQLSRAPGLPAYDQPDIIDFAGVAAKSIRLNIQSNWGGILMSYGLSEVQIFSIPAAARMPEPASGAADVLPDDVVTWRAGRGADQHTIYMGTDPNEVADGLAPSVQVSSNSLNLSTQDLQLGQTYYWRVNEVNEAEAVSVWAGPVWSLTVVDSLTVDDFEGYSNTSPDRPFQTWHDGFGYSADEFFPAGYSGNGTGCGIGHDIWSLTSPHYNGDIMETSNTVPGSGQSMPFYYTNSGAVASESQRTLAVAKDWTTSGVKTLSIAFNGEAGNTGTLFAIINNTKVTYDRDNGNISRGAWQAWNIDLTAVNTNLSSVSSLTLGVEGNGASGMILFDDIRLFAEAGELLTPIDPGTNGLVGAWSFDEGSGSTAIDSSGNGRNGTIIDATWDTGAQGSALTFNGTSAYVNIDGYKGINAIDAVQQAFSISNWVKTTSDSGDTEMVTWGASSGTAARLTWRVHEGRVRTEHNAGNLRGNTYINDGEWHHVALVVSEGANLRPEDTKLYVDGFEDSTFSGDDDPYNLVAEHDVRIGMSGPQDGRYFPGSLDEVWIYDRPLSAVEILYLAGMTEPVDKPF